MTKISVYHCRMTPNRHMIAFMFLDRPTSVFVVMK